jgi:uncharacterized protein (TIGR02145 family)
MIKIITGLIVLIIMASASFASDCGNANGDQVINLLDVSFIINGLYRGGPMPNPIQSADVNNDGKMNLLDVSYIINYLYRNGPAPNCPTFYLAPDTTKIIPADSVNAIISCDTLGKIILNGLSSYGQNVSIGDFIIGQNEVTAPDGFLRKVISKTVHGDSIILETNEAALMDAFKSMHISETHQLRPSDVKSSKMLKGSSLKSNSNSDLFTIQFNHVFYDQDGDSETTGDQIKLSGEYDFTAALFANIEISWFSLKKFETGIQTNQNANVDVTANLQWNFDQEQKFDLAEFKLGAIPVGGVVWLVPTLVVRAYIHGDLTITFETGISYTQELRYGFGYANDAFYDINECSKSFTYTPPQFTAEFNFEPGVSLDASCLLYGVAGPYMGGKAGFHFQSVLRNDPCGIDLDFNLNAILYAVVGVKCKILRLDYNKDYQLFTHPIGEWTFPLSGSGTIVIDPEPNSLDASWTIEGPCDYSKSGNGDMNFTYLDLGDYTVTWGAVSGWTAPSNSTQTLASGQTLTFTGIYIEIIEVPALTTVAVSAITQITAQCGGNITSDGGATVTVRGVCWSTNPTPTVADSKTTDGTGTGSFTSSIISLTAGTPYYVRAYATNSAGTGYGNAQSFTTLANNTIPVLTTASVSAITQTTAQCGGNITSDGGATVTVRGVCWSTNPTPTIANSKTTNGTGTGSFISSITDLSPSTPYYVRAYATNSVGTGYGNTQSFTTAGSSGTVTDIDGNVYQTVTIGTQVWMAENLKVTHYRNGEAIPNVTDNTTWYNLTTGAYCEYNNDLNNVATYGRLYNWHAVGDSRNIAPTGWHVPTDAEWQTLVDYLGGSSVAGGKMKEAGTTHWLSPNTGATNESGFSGLPGGGRSSNGPYDYVGYYACFWSSTEGSSSGAWCRYLYCGNSVVTRLNDDKHLGFSVRCVKDAEENTVTDIDGNVYQTVTIGPQVWMAENLKVTHYRNGDAIPNVTDNATWAGLSTGAYCEYNNDINYVATYGRLYNWYAAVDSRNIAPAGWHVPTDAEWKQLEMFLGMSQAQADVTGWRGTTEGGKMKEAGTTHWLSPNTGATNESGFSGLPGGYRYFDGFYYGIGYSASFWSSTEGSSNGAWIRRLGLSNSVVYRFSYGKPYGFSVRCVRDY